MGKKISRLLSLLLSLCLVATLLPVISVPALATDGQSVTINSYTEWETFRDGDLETWDGGGYTITLTGNISGSLIIPASVTSLTIQSDNGTARTISSGIYANGPISLTLNNISVSNSGGSVIDFRNSNSTDKSSTLHGEGTVKLTHSGGSGNCISVGNGDLTITGTIGNITSSYDSGISVSNGNLTISGTVGNINASTSGIYSNSGSVTITGAVSSITASGNSDGIYARTDVTISGTMGKITGGRYGIYSNNSANYITINSPVEVSGSSSSAFKKQPVIGLANYTVTWSAYADGSNSGIQTNGYTWNDTHKYVKIQAIQQLAQVDGVTLSDAGLAEWNNLADQTGLANYSVQLYKGGEALGDPVTEVSGGTGVDFLDEMRAAGVGDYTVKVTAIGDGTTYANGQESAASAPQSVAKLATPTNLAWHGTNATFNRLEPETNVAKYSITITGTGTVGSADVAKTGANLTVAVTSPAADDTFKVKAIAETTGLWLDSDEAVSAGYVVPEVTAVTVSPSAVTVQKGETYQFTADVTSAGDADDSVTWSVDSSDGSVIDEYGLLTIDPDETATALTVTATSDFDSTKSGTATVTVSDTPTDTAPAITTNTLPGGTVGAAYSKTLAADGTAPITWTIESGDLPDGLTLNGSTGVISGTPTTAGTFDFTVEAANSAGSDIKALSIEIAAATTYTITFNPNGGTVSETTRTITQGTAIGALPTPTRTGSYSFDGWYTSASGGTKITAATVPAGNTTYYAQWTSTGGGTAPSNPGNSGGSSGGGSSTPAPAPAPAPAPTPAPGTISGSGGGTSTVDVPVAVQTNANTGTAAVTINLDTGTKEALITDAIAKAEEAKSGAATDEQAAAVIPTVTLDLSGVENAKTAVLNAEATKMFSEAEVAVTVALPDAEIKMMPDALAAITQAAEAAGLDSSAPVTVEAAVVPMQDLQGMQAAQVKGYETVVSIDIFVGDSKVDVPITVSLPYTLKPNEDPNGVCVWHLDDNGNLTKLKGVYNPETGMITFSIDHQSYFVTGYDPVALWTNSFADVSSELWYYDAVAYASYHGLMAGVGNGRFMPVESMSRAMFVTVLWNLEGKPEANGTASFNDVGDAWYTGAVLWAAENGIVNGVGDGNYAPDRAISRQEMAVMLANYAAFKGYEMPKNREMPSFTDKAAIDSWAQTAVKEMAEAGVISGMGNDEFAPKNDASRAAVAQMFKNFMQFVKGE